MTRMRLTILNQFYVPDLAPTGHLAASLAEHRAQLGDIVTVVTSQGGYVPQSARVSRIRSSNPRVHRVWTPRLGKKSVLSRLTDYVTFYVGAALRVLTLPRQDVIVSLTTPPFIAWAAALHKRLHPSTKLVLWSMDCYPEALERSGAIASQGVAARLMRALNRRLYRHLDQLVCLDEAMRDLLLGRYREANPRLPVAVISNWEPADLFPPDLDPPRWSALDGLGEGQETRFVLLYLGNAGVGHAFKTLLRAAQALKDAPILFLFVGGGGRWASLEKETRALGLSNLCFFPYVEKQTTPSVMAAADAALITLRDGFEGVISPSKMHANLAMRLPILYIGPQGSNVDAAIQAYGCGASLRNGDLAGIVATLRAWARREADFEVLRARARAAFDEAFCDRVALPRFDQLLDSLLS